MQLNDEHQPDMRPLLSLLSKCEKAQGKLKAGTWQHTMLQENLRALRIALVLLQHEHATVHFTPAELQQSLNAMAAMIARTETTLYKFAPGTSQHTLQRNRLAALRLAHARIKAELDAH